MQKKRGTDALHGRSPARYYEKKVLFHELANDDSTIDSGAEYVGASGKTVDVEAVGAGCGNDSLAADIVDCHTFSHVAEREPSTNDCVSVVFADAAH